MTTLDWPKRLSLDKDSSLNLLTEIKNIYCIKILSKNIPLGHHDGASTLGIMTLSIMALSITKNVTISINSIQYPVSVC